MGCLHDPVNVQRTSSKCIQNTRANAGRLLDVIAGSCKHPISSNLQADKMPIADIVILSLNAV